jgi:hypothetical protein
MVHAILPAHDNHDKELIQITGTMALGLGNNDIPTYIRTSSRQILFKLIMFINSVP